MFHDLYCEKSSTSSETYSVSFTSTPGIATSSGFEYDILEAHNKMRALYCVKSFSLNETLVKYAAEYATASFSCDNVTLVHSNGLYGENLAAVYSGGYKPIDVWYDEIKEYDFNNSGYNESTGHFTQLIWNQQVKLVVLGLFAIILGVNTRFVNIQWTR